MGELVALLALVAPDLVKRLEGGLSPDHETAQVRARGELEKVERVDVGNLDTRDVAERLDDALVLLVDDKGATALGEAATPELALAGAHVLAAHDLSNVLGGTNGLKEGNSLLGAGDGLNTTTDNEGNLRDLLDLVATGEDKRGDTRGGDGSSSSVATLVLVHLDVPLAPRLGGGEHAARAAHVTEGTLARSVSTRATDTGNTGNGTTGTPGLSTGLLTSVGGDSVSLTLVLSNTDENRVDKVQTDGGVEDGGESSARASIRAGVDGNLGAGHYWY